MHSASQATAQALPALLSTADVLTFLGISRPSLWRLERDGKFPSAITIGSRSKRWLREDVEQYVRERRSVAQARATA